MKNLHVLLSAAAAVSALFLSGVGGNAKPGASTNAVSTGAGTEPTTPVAEVAPLPVPYHHPHDVCSAVALAPNFPEDPTVFTASWGSMNLFLRSKNRGFGWRNLRSGMRGHRIADCSLAPDWATSKTMFVALEEHGLQRSTSAGEIWGDVVLDELITEVKVAPPSKIGRCVLAAGGKSVFMSVNNGDTWATIGSTSHEVLTLAIPPSFAQEPMVAIGTAGNEVLIRTRESEWVSTKLPAPIEKLHFSPNFTTDNTIWAGTRGRGLYRSGDRGKTFTQVGGVPSEINDIAIAPTWPECKDMFLCTPQQGVHASRDGGVTWERLPVNVMETKQTENHYQQLQISPNYPAEPTIYMGAYEGLYCSNDGGENWYEFNLNPTRIGRKVAISPNYKEDGHVFLCGYGSPMAVSSDRGKSWEFRQRGTRTMSAFSVAASPEFEKDQSIYIGAGRGIRLSRDIGVNWEAVPVEPVAQSLQIKTYEIRQMTFSPRFPTDRTMFSVSKGGFFTSTDAGETWTGKKIPVDWVWSVAVPPSWPEDRSVFIGGHNVWRSDDDGDTWQKLAYTGKVLGLVCDPDYAQTGRILIVSREKGLLQSRDRGRTWQSFKDAFDGFSPTKVCWSPNYENDGTVFVSTVAGGMYWSQDRGETWARCAELGGLGDAIFDFVVSPNFAEDRTLFACIFEGLVKTEDAAKTWTLATNREIYDDMRDPWIFRGLWTRQGGKKLIGPGVHSARAAGRVANLAFTGTGVELLGHAGPDKGKCEVLIDGESRAVCDCYAPKRDTNHTIFKIEGLEQGFHDVCMRVLGTKNEESTNSWITIDAAFVDYSPSDGNNPLLAKLENIYLTPGASYARDTESQNASIAKMDRMLRSKQGNADKQGDADQQPAEPATSVASRLRALQTKDPELRRALQDLLLKLDHLSNEMAAIHAQVESLDRTFSRKKPGK